MKKKKTKKEKGLKVHGDLKLVPPPEAHKIARSFSMKISLGNYEMAEFFASQDAYAKPGEEEKISEALYKFVKSEVVKSINQFKFERSPQGKSSQEVRDRSKDEAENGVADFN